MQPTTTSTRRKSKQPSRDARLAEFGKVAERYPVFRILASPAIAVTVASLAESRHTQIYRIAVLRS